MKKQLFYLPVYAILLASCSGEQTNETEKDSTALECIMPAPNQISELSWILGDWKNEADGILTTESWVKTSDVLLTGESHSIDMETGDTVFFESIEIRHESTGLVYSPVVKDQNDGEAVDFLLMLLNDSTIEFENPQHDFPQKITYRRFGTDSIAATISGMSEGKEASAVFPMKRVK